MLNRLVCFTNGVVSEHKCLPRFEAKSFLTTVITISPYKIDSCSQTFSSNQLRIIQFLSLPFCSMRLSAPT